MIQLSEIHKTKNLFFGSEPSDVAPVEAIAEDGRSLGDYLALTTATGFGVGYAPVVPATWGSLAGVGIFLLARWGKDVFLRWRQWGETGQAIETAQNLTDAACLIFLVGLFLAGIAAASRTEKITGRKDARVIVIDEICGLLLVFFLLPAAVGWQMIAAGFIVFRIFDVLKPYPANRLEILPGGLGVMADDAMAGIYTAAVLSFAGAVFRLWI